MLLHDLLMNRSQDLTQGDLGVEITGIYYSSRQVTPGGLFVAIPGYRVDGHAYIEDAIERGAVAVVVSKDVGVPNHVSVVTVQDSRQALAELSANYYGNPSKQMRMIGVTGTNGKTTVTYLLDSILRGAGLSTGLLGTIGMRIGARSVKASHTTPESRDLQATLREMLRTEVSHVIMEVSSHSLALSRVTGVEYDTAVFTNLTQDHLDFHSDMDDYFRAKVKLFSQLGHMRSKPHKAAVINGDDSYGKQLLSLCPADVRLLRYGLDAQNDLYVSHITSGIKGSTFTMHTPEGSIDVTITTPGIHSVYNALAAAGAALVEGVSLDSICTGLACAGIPGRMQSVDEGQDFGVFVDYAHSPDSLDNVLQACRSFTEGRLIVVFGCGGDRDRGKRPIMGEMAARLADIAVLTSDNPRSEDPMEIIHNVLAGVNNGHATEKMWVEPDRRAAIRLAIGAARAGDVVLLAGKGHETYQILPQETIEFDDRKEARLALKEVVK